jgi:integration host factor subunit alpha
MYKLIVIWHNYLIRLPESPPNIVEFPMALTKADIVQLIMDQVGFTNNKSSEITETLIEIMKRTLAAGEDVLVSGFGKFCVREKAERRGRNPATGNAMKLKPRKVVTFKVSGKLRRKINS